MNRRFNKGLFEVKAALEKAELQMSELLEQMDSGDSHDLRFVNIQAFMSINRSLMDMSNTQNKINKVINTEKEASVHYRAWLSKWYGESPLKIPNIEELVLGEKECSKLRKRGTYQGVQYMFCPNGNGKVILKYLDQTNRHREPTLIVVGEWDCVWVPGGGGISDKLDNLMVFNDEWEEKHEMLKRNDSEEIIWSQRK